MLTVSKGLTMPSASPAVFVCLAAIASCSLWACAPDYQGPSCAQWRAAPKSSNPFHPRLWRGTLRGLPQAKARAWTWPGAAHAFAYEQEQALADQTVEIVPHDGAFAPKGPARHRATTDAKGRWCVVVDADVALDGSFLVHAPEVQGAMRQVATHAFDLSINAQTEALTRWAAKRPGAATWTPSHWLNLRTLADTAAGLLGQVKPQGAASQSELITQVGQALDADARLKAWPLAATPTRQSPQAP